MDDFPDWSLSDSHPECSRESCLTTWNSSPDFNQETTAWSSSLPDQSSSQELISTSPEWSPVLESTRLSANKDNGCEISCLDITDISSIREPAAPTSGLTNLESGTFFSDLDGGWESLEAEFGDSTDIFSSSDPMDGSFHIRLGFSQPLLLNAWGVAVDRRQNNSYLTDQDGNEVVVVNSQGSLIKRFGLSHGPCQKWRPTGIVVDQANDRIIVTDNYNYKVVIFSMLGEYRSSFGSKGQEDGSLNFPWGVDVSKDGQWIAVADSGNHRIQIFDKNGVFVRKYNPVDFRDEFEYPRGIVFDNLGENLYVTDSNGLFKLNFDLTSKEMILPAESLLNNPQGLTMDPASNILMCDGKANLIRVIEPDGSYVGSLEQSGEDPFSFPTDVAVFSDGKVALVDKDCRFRVF